MSEPVSSAGAPRRAERAAAPSSPLRLADSPARAAASVVGRLLAARARAVAEGATVLGAAAARGCLDAARTAHPARKTILFYWIEDVLPMMVMDIRAREVLGGETEAFRFVCDDTFGGCVAESLLSRLGRPAEALHAAVSRPRDEGGMPSPLQAAGALPSLVDLAAASGEWDLLRKACRDRGDEITFAATLVAEGQNPQRNRGPQA
jgi:hypothetical protein